MLGRRYCETLYRSQQSDYNHYLQLQRPGDASRWITFHRLWQSWQHPSAALSKDYISPKYPNLEAMSRRLTYRITLLARRTPMSPASRTRQRMTWMDSSN